MKQAVIMCGGIGSRLKKKYPKVLLKINKKTILEHQLDLCKQYGFQEFLLLTGYKSEMIKKFIKKNNILEEIKIIKEKKKLGTGGALLSAFKHLDKEFFLIYGDIFTNMNLKKMYTFFKKKKTESCLVINRNNNYQDSNLLSISKDRKINKFYFYPHAKIPKNSYSNEAIFMFKKNFFKNLNTIKLIKKPDLVKDVLPAIKLRKKIYAFKTNELIIDCGTSDRLQTARLKL
jgi:NDP-sugar pyrophosphorylase family protein